jgi:excisionase family DNA binding protein
MIDKRIRTDSARITVEEISRRLGISVKAVYALLERNEIPAIRLGRRWIISKHAYQVWEQTFGEHRPHLVAKRA